MDLTFSTAMADPKPPPNIPTLCLPTALPQDDERSMIRHRMLDSPFQTRHSTSFNRIQHKLMQDPATSDPIIYLLRCDGDVVQHYQYLVSRGEPVWVKSGGRSLNLALTAELWHDLIFCIANHEMRLLSSSLHSVIGAEHWLLQRGGVPGGYARYLQSPFAASASTRTSSGGSGSGSGSLKRKRSNASSRSNHSRRPSVTTVDTGETPSTLEPQVTYTCPLVAHGHCKENQSPYVKLGNCKNHVERVHRWYTDQHPDWANEIVVGTRRSGDEVSRSMQPSPSPFNSTDMNLAYVGMESSVDPAAAMPGACGGLRLDFPSNQPCQSAIPQNLPQTSSNFDLAEATAFQPESENTFLEDTFGTEAGMTLQHGTNNLQAPLTLPSRPIYREARQLFNNAPRQGPSPAPPNPALPPWPPYR